MGILSRRIKYGVFTRTTTSTQSNSILSLFDAQRVFVRKTIKVAWLPW